MKQIKDARSLKDISKIIRLLTSQVDEEAQDAQDLLKTVSKSKSVKISISSKTVDLADLNRGTSTRGVSAKKIANFKPPKLADLVKDSKTLGRFAQQIAELEAVKMTLLGDSFANLPNTKQLIRSAEKSLKEAKAARDKQLKAMSLAITSKPKEVKAFVKVAMDHIDAIIPEEEYSRLKQRSYILHPTSDTIWYQTYITLQDLVAADDFLYDEYTFVATTIVSLEDGELQNSMTSIKGRKIPGTFHPGKVIKGASNTKRHINVLLSADDVHVTKNKSKGLGKTKFPTTETLKDTKILKANEHVKNVRIMGNNVIFKLEEGVDNSEIKEAVDRLKVTMNTLYSNDLKGSSSLKHKVTRSSLTDNVLVTFNLVPTKTPTERTLLNVEQAALQMGMDKKTTRKFKDFMLNGR